MDWSQKETDKIQCVAFYSDCKHGVLEVKTGHRITLTYNLYVNERLGGVIRQNPSVDSNHYGLSKMIMDGVEVSGFHDKGGRLVFYCQHVYAHTNEDHRKRLLYALKGVDAIFYSIFYHMGLKVKVQPVIKGMPDEYYLENIEERKPKLREQLQKPCESALNSTASL